MEESSPTPEPQSHESQRRRRRKRHLKRTDESVVRRPFPWVWVFNGLILMAAAGAAGYFLGRSGPESVEPGETVSVAVETAETSYTSEQSDLMEMGYRNPESPELKPQLEALRRGNPTPLSRWLEAWHLAFAGEMVASNNILLESVRSDPDYGESYLLRAKLLAAQGQYESAVNTIEEGARRDPGHAELFYFWGQILRSDGRPRRGQSKLEQALFRNRDPVRHPFFDTTLKLARIEAGEEVSVGSDFLESNILGAGLAVRQGDFQEAARLLNQGEEMLPPGWFQFFAADPLFWHHRHELGNAGATMANPFLVRAPAHRTATTAPEPARSMAPLEQALPDEDLLTEEPPELTPDRAEEGLPFDVELSIDSPAPAPGGLDSGLQLERGAPRDDAPDDANEAVRELFDR